MIAPVNLLDVDATLWTASGVTLLRIPSCPTSSPDVQLSMVSFEVSTGFVRMRRCVARPAPLLVALLTVHPRLSHTTRLFLPYQRIVLVQYGDKITMRTQFQMSMLLLR